MNLPVWPVLVLLVLAAVREAAREFLSFLLTKIRYTLTRSSPGTRGAPSVSVKGTPSCHTSPCGQSDPSGHGTRSLPSAAVQGRKPHAGSGGVRLWGLLWQTQSTSAAHLPSFCV